MMHKLVVLLFVFAGIDHLSAINPAISMGSSKDVGAEFMFEIQAPQGNVIGVDFGNGEVESYTMGQFPMTVIGELGSAQNVFIYGDAISYLNCSDQKVNALNVDQCITLESLTCYSNELSNLELSNCTKLSNLECSNNNLGSIDLTNCHQLKHFGCNSCQLTTLNVTQNTILETLCCVGNQLSELDLSQCLNLGVLECYFNNLTELNLSLNNNLISLNCASNNLYSLNITSCEELKFLDFTNNLLQSVEFSYFPDLEVLECGFNSLIQLPIENFPKVKKLNCSHNALTELLVENCPLLMELYCDGNGLSDLNLNSCCNLEKLNCSVNKLNSLDLSGCSQLTNIDCYHNGLTALDLSECSNLTSVECRSNYLNFVTLPTRTPQWLVYNYAPQAPISIPSFIEPQQEVNLSYLYDINGTYTTYSWKTEEGTLLIDGIDYEINEGVTTFLKSLLKPVYCEMTNALFPGFCENKVLKTSNTNIVVATEKREISKSSLGINVNNQVVHLMLPYEAQIFVYDNSGRMIQSMQASVGYNVINIKKVGMVLIKISSQKEVIVTKLMVR